MLLIATWNQFQDSATEDPEAVRWYNETKPASIHDYHTHQLDTQWFVHFEDRTELHIDTEVTGTVLFNIEAGVWQVRGENFQTFLLNLGDPFAPDDQIIAELWTFPTSYRCEIVRYSPWPLLLV